ncbi:MAG: hypothetical protein JSS56_16275 [Proteobacteria bacterium]|nr:hypothetical protein [Pseudomonadota bacterium]
MNPLRNQMIRAKFLKKSDFLGAINGGNHQFSGFGYEISLSTTNAQVFLKGEQLPLECPGPALARSMLQGDP